MPIGIYCNAHMRYSKGTQQDDSDIEKLLGKKVDVLTPAGIKSIRIKKVANNIKNSIKYV